MSGRSGQGPVGGPTRVVSSGVVPPHFVPGKVCPDCHRQMWTSQMVRWVPKTAGQRRGHWSHKRCDDLTPPKDYEVDAWRRKQDIKKDG